MGKDSYALLLAKDMIQERTILLIAAIVFIAITLATFPTYFASIDEHEFLKNSFLLQQGTLSEPDRTAACTGAFDGSGYTSQYFIGRSLFLIPFTFLGFGAVLLSGLVIHLLNLGLFAKIMKRLGHSPLYSLLYLLYPAFLWEARTINSELLALTALLVGTIFYLSHDRCRYASAGFFFILAALVRQETLLIAGPFFLLPLLRERKKFAFMLAGALPAIALLLGTNALFYGGALSTGYGSPLTFIFSIGTHPLFWENLLKLITLTAIAYPLMLFSPLASKKLRWELILATIGFIIFFSQNTAVAQFPLLHPTAFTGQLRYLVPLLGLLLVAYPPLFERVVRRLRLPPRPVLGIAIILLFLVAAGASVIHGSFLDARKGVFDHIYTHTTDGSLLIGSSDDCNYVLNELFPERAYLDVGTTDLESYLPRHSDVFILEISYSTVDYSSSRGNLVADERQGIADFLANNNVELVFETTRPHVVNIYKLSV